MAKAKTTVEKSVGSNDEVVNQVVEIIQLMGDNRLEEIELETSELKMTLKKHASIVSMPVIQHVQHNPVPLSVPQTPVAEINANGKKRPESSEKAAEPESNYHKIISPMAGTFYRAPSPTSASFVNEGDTVIVGQTVCIVEAMKMMNEIKADKAGKVVKILIENGKPVEKGANLFFIGE